MQQKLHTQLQRKGMSKLLGLDCVIQYCQGKENVAADALSRQVENGVCNAITSVMGERSYY